MDKVILGIIAFFFFLGALDYLLGNKFKLGDKFQDGIKSMGPLAIAMVGIFSISPIIAKGLSLVITPIAKTLSLDPSLFPSMVLAIDMGAFQLSESLALSEQMAKFSGVIIASTLGATISFSIPLAIGMIKKEDHHAFSKGIMCGIITVPVGALVGGIMMRINIAILVTNLIPIIVISTLLTIGIIKMPKKVILGFSKFGKIIVGVSVIGLMIQGVCSIIGINSLYGLMPIEESLAVVGKIAIVMAGAYPMLEVLKRIFNKSFDRVGNAVGMNASSIGAFIGSLASNIVVFGDFSSMNEKGKIICTAFSVSGAFILGGQMGFVSSQAQDMLIIYIVSKLIAGITSVFLANFLYEMDRKKAMLVDVIS